MSNILIVKNPKENREVCRFFLIRFTSCVAVLSLQDIKLKRGYGKKRFNYEKFSGQCNFMYS